MQNLNQKGDDQKYLVVEVCERGEEVVIINYCNPYKRLDFDSLLQSKG